MTLAIAVEERDRFAELAHDPHFPRVVAANRLYLTAAVADALATERRHWALSSLPATGVLSTLSIGGQETFALFASGADGLTAHVYVSRSVLEASPTGSGLPGLEVRESARAGGGPDQVTVHGPWAALAPVLASTPLRTAARDFAQRLLPSRTKDAYAHDPRLADLVLGRA
ncbi:hypothetical protein [Symbioplanes lichenis]|uniref:hypothetical protein n=1 Tax=Symbioplanes lichenis TaxID=1629072 RepID=UPI0027386C70|nr:hypothetical protein [Actinoplanes lichenis]